MAEIKDYDPRALPPDWAIDAWAGLEGVFLTPATNRVKYGPRSDWASADEKIYRPWLNGPALWEEEFWPQVLATVEAPEGREWCGEWGMGTSVGMSHPAGCGVVERQVDNGDFLQRGYRPITPAYPEPGFYLVEVGYGQHGQPQEFLVSWDGRRFTNSGCDSIRPRHVTKWVRLEPVDD